MTVGSCEHKQTHSKLLMPLIFATFHRADTLAMSNYHITVREDGHEPCMGLESHLDLEAAHQSAVRSAVDILMESKVLNGSHVASVSVYDPATDVTRVIRVAVLVSHADQRGDA